MAMPMVADIKDVAEKVGHIPLTDGNIIMIE